MSVAAKDYARTDFAAIESDHEVIQKQLARLPTRRELTGTAFRISLGDDDADETERAVLSALVGRIRRVVPASGIGLR